MEKKEALQGEGDRESDRHYRDRTREFVEAGRVEPAAKEAERAYDADPEELEAAEEHAKRGPERTATDGFNELAKHNDLGLKLSELSSLREALRIRMHLGKKDAQDLFLAAEDKWNALATRVSSLTTASKESADNIRAAAKLLIDEIAESYERLKHA